MSHLTAQPQFTSVLSVISTAIPTSQVTSMMKNGIILSEYVTAQTWYPALPSDVRNYASSAASQIAKLASGTPSANAAQETGGWRLMQGAMVGAAGAVAGIAML